MVKAGRNHETMEGREHDIYILRSLAMAPSPHSVMRGAWDQAHEFVRIVIDRLVNLHEVDCPAQLRFNSTRGHSSRI